MATISETDLYKPVASFLRARGYEVRGEVHGVDVVARRDNEIVAVELKRSMGLELILQAVERQRSTDGVYVAVPSRKKGPPLRNLRRVNALLKRLELGLILVHFRQSGTVVEVRFHPKSWTYRRSHRERRYIIREFDGRTGDRNAGGTSGRVVTAYREHSIHIACALMLTGPTSPAALRALGTVDTTGAILLRNVYGWFDHPEKGLYAIHDAGIKALKSYPELAKHYSAEVKNRGQDALPKKVTATKHPKDAT